MAEDSELQFAVIDWHPRWNASPHTAALDQSGSKIWAVGWFGVVRLDLEDDESVEALVKMTRGFADLIENTKKTYDEAVGNG